MSAVSGFSICDYSLNVGRVRPTYSAIKPFEFFHLASGHGHDSGAGIIAAKKRWSAARGSGGFVC